MIKSQSFSTKFLSFAFALAAVLLITTFVSANYTDPSWSGDKNPPVCPDGAPGCEPPIDVSLTSQIKDGALSIGGILRTLTGLVVGPVNGPADLGLSTGLALDVEGNVGAKKYCNEKGEECKTITELGGGPGDAPLWMVTADKVSQYSYVSGSVGIGVIPSNPSPLTPKLAVEGLSTAGTPLVSIYGTAASGRGLIVHTAQTESVPILDAISGLNPNARSRFRVLGDGNVCIGGDCRTAWPIGGNINTTGLQSGCGTNITGKVYWDGTKFVCGEDRGGGGAGDNLGDHIALKNIRLSNSTTNWYLSGDGGDEGLKIYDDGSASFSSNFEVGGNSSLKGTIAIGGGNPAVGKVLTATSALGTAAWDYVNTASIAADAVTNSKLGVTYNIFTCINAQWPGSTVCELGSYKFCTLSAVRTGDVACAVNPTTSRASSLNDYVNGGKIITSGSFSGAKWWYLQALEGNLFSSGSCRAICY